MKASVFYLVLLLGYVNFSFADQTIPVRDIQEAQMMRDFPESILDVSNLLADNGLRRRPGQGNRVESEDDTFGPVVPYKDPNRRRISKEIEITNTTETERTETETTKVEAAKIETTKIETTKIETTKIETSKIETTKIETTKIETSKIETSKTETSKIETSKTETSKTETSKTETSKTETTGTDKKTSVPRVTFKELARPAHPFDPSDATRIAPVPDRWRLASQLGLVKESLFDPYHRNVIKADRPFCCDDWFFSASVISDTVIEPRSFPVPVASVGTNAGQLDLLGSQDFTVASQSLIFPFVLYKGDTVFRPPDYEFRFTPVLNYNRVEADESRLLFIDPSEGEIRTDEFFAIQELFADIHLRNVSDRYDFDSIRVGIQPFSTDFRGFLFQDLQLGARLFGNRNNNIFQYNLAAFRRVEKDTNSGLNDIGQSLRKDDVFVANLYIQDMPSKGFTSQVTAVHNRNRERSQGQHVDDNGFVVRPAPVGTQRLRDYDVTYLGYNGDGHFGRMNLTTSLYYAFGDESTGAFTDKPSNISAFFGAAEASIDFDWMRFRGSFLYGSGDEDPFDDESNGFDAIFENPIFAGADTSYWTRQTVPLIGGGGALLSGRNGILNSLRSSKEEGQSNFTNPGITLLGLGADFDVTPELRISANVNKLYFNETEVLKVLRNQGNIDRDIGLDVSVSAIYRPFTSQNAVLRLSGAALYPGQGFKDLFGDKVSYSILANITLTY